jgi:hypothetical protein
MTQVAIPAGSTYGVLPKRFPYGCFFFGNLEDVVEFITVNRLAFQSEVIRVAGDVLVWPIHSKGGSA